VLTGFCGRGDCTGYCPDCYEDNEEEGEEMATGMGFNSCDCAHELVLFFSEQCPMCQILVENQRLKAEKVVLCDTLESAVEQLEEITRLTDGEVRI
jgi:hypothetical protein